MNLETMNKVLDLIAEPTQSSTIQEYKAELMFKVNSLIEAQVSEMLDATAYQDLEGSYDNPIKTLLPKDGEDMVDTGLGKKEVIQPPPPDRKGTNKIWRPSGN